jgi:hypothetical protein
MADLDLEALEELMKVRFLFSNSFSKKRKYQNNSSSQHPLHEKDQGQEVDLRRKRVISIKSTDPAEAAVAAEEGVTQGKMRRRRRIQKWRSGARRRLLNCSEGRKRH